jgi:hypothetical protein
MQGVCSPVCLLHSWSHAATAPQAAAAGKQTSPVGSLHVCCARPAAQGQHLVVVPRLRAPQRQRLPRLTQLGRHTWGRGPGGNTQRQREGQVGSTSVLIEARESAITRRRGLHTEQAIQESLRQLMQCWQPQDGCWGSCICGGPLAASDPSMQQVWHGPPQLSYMHHAAPPGGQSGWLDSASRSLTAAL